MTRINLVPPNMLSDKHLLAEYRELPRVFTLAKNSGAPFAHTVGNLYKLGPGHVLFFVNKIPWLLIRYKAIVGECFQRGFAIDSGLVDSVMGSAIDLINSRPDLCVEYNPTPEEFYLNMARICIRSNYAEVKAEILRADKAEREAN